MENLALLCLLRWQKQLKSVDFLHIAANPTIPLSWLDQLPKTGAMIKKPSPSFF